MASIFDWANKKLKKANEGISYLTQSIFPLESSFKDPWKRKLFDRMVEEEGYMAFPYTDIFSSKKGELQGVGHSNEDGGRRMGMWATPGEASGLLDEDITEKITKIEDMFPKRYGEMDEGMRSALVDMAFRGNIKGNHKFVKLLREGKRDAAADEYLNHDGYRRSKKAGTGIYGRMDENAALLRRKK
jgi:hypothetical protein